MQQGNQNSKLQQINKLNKKSNKLNINNNSTENLSNNSRVQSATNFDNLQQQQAIIAKDPHTIKVEKD